MLRLPSTRQVSDKKGNRALNAKKRLLPSSHSHPSSLVRKILDSLSRPLAIYASNSLNDGRSKRVSVIGVVVMGFIGFRGRAISISNSSCR